MLERYKTIKEAGTNEIEIKGSRFIAHFQRVTDEEQALEFIQAIKKEHWKATHNCSAFLIGENDQVQRAMDDGEPSGTAGVPMLEVLKKNELKDVAVVVTRYFGGTKLGAGGVGMIQVTLIIRITLVLAFIMLSYWALQGIQIEKILRKGRVQEARILFLLIAIWMGASIAKVIFDLSDYLNQYIQLILQ